jgi:hypothetical protein
MGMVSNPVQVLRMVARLPSLTPSSMGFYCPDLQQKVNQLLSSRKWDLIFVHCSSVAQYVAHVRDVPKILDYGDMDSQKWLEYANYKPWPLSWGYRLEGLKMLAAEKRLARSFDMGTATTGPNGKRLRAMAQGWFPTGSRTVSMPSFSVRMRSGHMIATRSVSSGGWITTRTRSACSVFVGTSGHG